MKTLLFILILALFACEKASVQPQYNAEIIGLETRKSYCMYGFKIKMGNDTILSTSEELFDRFRYTENFPVKTNLVIISMEDFCVHPYCDVRITNSDRYAEHLD
jgi:hypothetical protein